MATLAKELKNGTAVISSDGSVNNEAKSFKGTQGWVVYGTLSKSRIAGHGSVIGGGQPLSSLRPEMGGLCGALTAVDRILNSCPEPKSVTPLRLTALIDNKALINWIQMWNSVNVLSALLPEYNLLQASKSLSQKHSIKIDPRHVKSHQDNKKAYNELPWQAKLNCYCDVLAELVRECSECDRSAHKHYILPSGHGATLAIKGKFITAHLPKAVKEASYRSEMIQYITSNAKWTTADIFNLIDWDARSQASKRIRRDNRLSILKLEFGWFAPMSRRHLIDPQISPTCPRCQAQTEAFDHMLK